MIKKLVLPTAKHLSPAQYVIQVFGGVRKLARAINYDPSNVSRWPKAKGKHGGCNGIIPSSALNIILRTAQRNNYDLKAVDLICGRDIQ